MHSRRGLLWLLIEASLSQLASDLPTDKKKTLTAMMNGRSKMFISLESKLSLMFEHRHRGRVLSSQQSAECHSFLQKHGYAKKNSRFLNRVFLVYKPVF